MRPPFKGTGTQDVFFVVVEGNIMYVHAQLVFKFLD
jgi:hypothetical protein